ncbi:MAG: hypothetical protein KDC58_00170 [Cyclobacteriaceae bacterium]|nr:hypothetical protein [Cyclobacteriaceae bacterium]
MTKLGNEVILVTSNEPWGDVWYSKQNYAYELSKNNKVLFINPPAKWRFKNLLFNPIKTTSYTENLQYIDYNNFLPILNNFFNRLNNRWVSRYLKKYFEKKGIAKAIFWAFDPLRLYNHKLLGCKLGIYHCVDFYYSQFFGEHELCKNSDMIFATSQHFLDNFSQYDTPKYIVPHGISYEEFNLDEQILDYNDIGLKDYAIYVGVIDLRMDYSLLEQALKAFPDVQFLFVGPIRLAHGSYKSKHIDAAIRIFEEKVYSNVHAIGPIHFKQLKYYIKRAKFCISFMDMEYQANTIHHHKTLLYLAQGKPVFGPVFKEYQALDDLMYMDNNGGELIGLIDDFIKNGEDSNLAEERIRYARKFSFENILAGAATLIENHNS